MNTKKVQEAINKVFERISKMPTDEVKDLVEKTPDKWGELLLEGGFLDSLSTHLSSEDLLGKFPDLEISEPTISFSQGDKAPDDLFKYYIISKVFDSHQESWKRELYSFLMNYENLLNKEKQEIKGYKQLKDQNEIERYLTNFSNVTMKRVDFGDLQVEMEVEDGAEWPKAA